MMNEWQPIAGERIRWINCPVNCQKRGDSTGTFEFKNGGYYYVRLDGTNSIMELYLTEMEPIDD